MYIPRHYAQEDRGKLFEFMHNNSFGILFSHTGDEPMASHLPFVIDEVGDQGLILGHMAKANRQWRY
ncbi:MAG: FMN-binding negative transcriptional regulator, partial [Chloroflexota bacterium]|nr:FMN-binding negative transcriptional regulator [Chloroflexota bacterium]